jgi:large subunit ribosomal protein L15
LIRRLPKRGFTNKWRKEWSIINLCTLEDAAAVKNGAVVDKDFLLANRMIRKRQYPFKVLGKGKFTKSVTVKANSFSESAKKAIEAVGGKAEVVKYIPANKKAGE